MRASHIARVAAGVSALSLGLLMVASPASAATLPDGQRISVIGAVDPEEGALIDTTYTASPVDASAHVRRVRHDRRQ